MPGIKLETSARGGHVVVALRGELDVSGAADVEAAITAAVVPGPSVEAAVVSNGSRRRLYAVPGPAVSTGPPGRAAPVGTGTG